MNSVNSFKDIGKIYTPSEIGYKQVKRGEIYYVRKGASTGSEQSGSRPAVIVGNDIGNERSPVVLVVYLTTRSKPQMPTHAQIECKESSIALCEQIFPVDKSRLGDYIRTATDAEMQEVDKALAVSLGIAVPPVQIPEANPQDDDLLRMAVDRANDIASLVEHVRYVSGILSKVRDMRDIGFWGDEAVKIGDVLSSAGMQIVRDTAIEQIKQEKAVLLEELRRLIGNETNEDKAELPEESEKEPVKKSRGGSMKIEYDKDHLRELVGKGLSRQEIADAMGVSYPTVTRWLKDCGLTTVPPEKKKPAQTGKKCSTCKYRDGQPGRGSCNYLSITGHSRGCSPEDCTVYEAGNPDKRQKAGEVDGKI